MSAELMLRYPAAAAAAEGNILLRAVNTLNTPVISATWRNNGQAWHGTYTLTFTKVGALVTVDVLAIGAAADERNPWGDRAGLSVVADGATKNANVIPGVDLVVAALTDTGWKATVTIGNYLDAAATEVDVLELGVVQAGLVSSERRIAVRNVGTQTAEGTVLYALPGFYFYGTGATTLVGRIANHSDPTRHKLAAKGTYSLSFANWADDAPSGKKKADLLVDGVLAVQGALFDGSTFYEYGEPSGRYQATDELAGLGIMLADTTEDPTTAVLTLEVRDGYQWLQWAPDVAGAPGAYLAAGTDLTLGDITAADHEFAWLKVTPPGSVMPETLGRQYNIRARGLSI